MLCSCGCGRPAVARGLSKVCHQRARRAQKRAEHPRILQPLVATCVCGEPATKAGACQKCYDAWRKRRQIARRLQARRYKPIERRGGRAYRTHIALSEDEAMALNNLAAARGLTAAALIRTWIRSEA